MDAFERLRHCPSFAGEISSRNCHDLRQKGFTRDGLSEKEASQNNSNGQQPRPKRAVSDHLIFADIVYVDEGESDHQHRYQEKGSIGRIDQKPDSVDERREGSSGVRPRLSVFGSRAGDSARDL